MSKEVKNAPEGRAGPSVYSDDQAGRTLVAAAPDLANSFARIFRVIAVNGSAQTRELRSCDGAFEKTPIDVRQRSYAWRNSGRARTMPNHFCPSSLHSPRDTVRAFIGAAQV
ncbi:hypothetical protein [Nannocystis bainbridge]|uniref:Uncharacterized protein n=1 Tax=Nannocystis bainbridge TaxID=2995303 RepID=A0ABT5ECG1_9BACT|nr:hypothetical protein [Nannocystis bainbridge]MDC0723546.1 hypothetical protein [Nannocystis bainbridge]